MHATGAGDELPKQELKDLAAAVRAEIPAGAEDGLEPRARVFVKLLRADALVPAWTLAADNGSGTVQQKVDFSTSSGAARTSTQLPLFTLVDAGRGYAWLPGFRDPRWAVADSVFDVSADIVVRSQLDEIRLVDGRLLLSGWAYLTLLATSPEESVAVALDGPGGARVVVPAARLRRPDLVKGTGADLTRLAWAGWSAGVNLRELISASGDWRASVVVAHGELARTGELGGQRGPLAQDRLLHVPHEMGGHVVRVVPGNDALVLRIQGLGTVARVVPQRLRSAARHVVR